MYLDGKWVQPGVSTHSHPKVAELKPIQLRSQQTVVSTHSHPKVADFKLTI